MTTTAATAGIIWAYAARFFVAQGIVQSRWTPSFSPATNHLSDLVKSLQKEKMFHSFFDNS